jgi:hypothetical protein
VDRRRKIRKGNILGRKWTKKHERSERGKRNWPALGDVLKRTV